METKEELRKDLKNIDFGNFKKSIDEYINSHHCTSCIHFEFDKKKTLIEEKKRIQVQDKNQSINIYYGKCLKKKKEIKADVRKIYRGTFICYENELKL